ncbi:tumor necrosis factor receptor superfamily member 5 isoform X2 [Scleropages formosus]|uniref:Tumor necrosis factor receptor superfamily member 5-like n=2 Tax=Scleropages formosus TaxID=113540 RepID=A0A8C9SH40_SCLFO|nr:tumor necrosis factor receptor superfamily member 5-like isoform X2 [Scleropages formosus]
MIFFFIGGPALLPVTHTRHAGAQHIYPLLSIAITQLQRATAPDMGRVARTLLFLHAVAVFTAMLATCCDLETQVERDGICCNKCEPGTKLKTASCPQPECVECPDNEYQPFYTLDTKCLLQDYCDPNLNFDNFTREKVKKIPCKCKAGYYCSTDQCITCAEHTECSPGFGVTSLGTSTNDTICSPCPVGKFSSTTSSFDKCQPWQVCEHGYIEKQPGTAKSDRLCEKPSSVIRTGIVVGALFGCVIFAVVLLFISNPGYFKNVVKRNKKKEFQVNKPGSVNEYRAAQENDEISDTMHPVPVQDQLTENNNPLAQEEGKQHLLSQPASDSV